MKLTVGKTDNTIVSNVAQHRVIEIPAESNAKDRPPPLARIPSHADLRREIQIRLALAPAQPRNIAYGVQRTNARQIRICAPSITDVLQSVGEREIGASLPAILRVSLNASIAHAAAGGS